MTLSIRNPEADSLARRLADLEGVNITDAVVLALKEALRSRLGQETPSETARRILERRGLMPSKAARAPVPSDAYHDLDHELT